MTTIVEEIRQLCGKNNKKWLELTEEECHISRPRYRCIYNTYQHTRDSFDKAEIERIKREPEVPPAYMQMRKQAKPEKSCLKLKQCEAEESAFAEFVELSGDEASAEEASAAGTLDTPQKATEKHLEAS